jgi:ferredoxin
MRIIVDRAPSPDQQESIEAACAACPTGALTLFKD